MLFRSAYRSDAQRWGIPDFWATPLELIGQGAGDCEDFAVAKYFALKNLGVATSRLKLMYARTANKSAGHVVLAYYPGAGAEPFILDNENTNIVPLSQRRDLHVIYGFNTIGVWRMAGRTRPHWAGSSNRLRNWWRLMRRHHLQEPSLQERA